MKSPGTHWIGGCVELRTGLEAVKKRKIFYSRESKPGRPAIPTPEEHE
jgi:hypothetical protein